MKRYTFALMTLGVATALASGVFYKVVQARSSYDERTGVVTNERWSSGVPLGGIGVGKVEVFTDGSFGRAVINHNWDRPTGEIPGAYAVVSAGGVKRALRRAPDNGEISGAPNVANTAYRGDFPSAEVGFTDPALPVRVQLHAWSSLIPNNAKDSSLPVGHLDYTVSNTTRRPQTATITFAWPNMLGFGGRVGREEWTSYAGNYEKPATAGPLHGILYGTTQSYKSQRQNVVGQYFLGANAPASTVHTQVSGLRTSQVAADAAPVAAVSVDVTLGPGQSKTVPFVLAWAMPTHIVTRKVISGYSEPKLDDNNIALAVDNNAETRWTTDRTMRPNDRIEITLPAETDLGTLTLDSARSPNDWPHGYRIEVADGGGWRDVRHATEQEAYTQVRGGVLKIPLTGVTARRIRVINTGGSSTWFWSIHELRLTDASDKLIPLSAANLHAYLTEPIYRESGGLNVGHYWQNSFRDVKAIAAYAATNAPRLWAQTVEWQNIVAGSNLPGWFRRQMVNAAFPVFTNTVLTKDGRFSVLESPIDMGGALGTMDQRMAAHALWIQFFSQQDRKELDMYAHAQDITPQQDGRITHFVGNVHETIGDPNVSYGVTDWPDLSASWIMQVLKEYRWTGDKAFLKRNLPHIEHAMEFLRNADKDGDLIPEGGSTYDYEHLPAGAFIYSASCYLGALRAASAAERAAGSAAKAKAYDSRLRAVQASIMKELWNGHGFRKWATPSGQKVENSFVASLAGDWLAQLSGLPRTLPNKTVDTEIRNLLTRHLWAFYPVPPMEVKPDGTKFTAACYMIQHQPYLGDEAIYQGYADDGMEVQRRMYVVTWPQNRSPWHESLVYNAPGGKQGGLVDYMTCPATWHTLNALTGTTLDIPDRTFYLAPHIPKSMGDLHVPVFFPTFWARVDAVPATKRLTVTVLKTFGATPAFTTLRGDVDAPPIALSRPLPVVEGARWDLSRYWDRLVAPTKPSLKPAR